MSLYNEYNNVVQPMKTYDCIIVGTGPAGLGAAFRLSDRNPALRLLVIDKETLCTGGLRHDCKMNFTYPVGFPLDCWTEKQAEQYLTMVIERLRPEFMQRVDLETYQQRAARHQAAHGRACRPQCRGQPGGDGKRY
jgi:predicted flavoprotein YhiN